MAEIYGQDPEGEAIRRRRAQAEALLAQSMQPQGNFTHQNSWLGPALQGIAGAVMQVMSGQEADKLSQQRQDEFNAFKSQLSPSSAVSPSLGAVQPPASGSAMSDAGAAPPPVNPTPAMAPAPNVPAQYGPVIQQAAQRNGIPPDILSRVIGRESNFNPGAVGSAGEIGMGQVKPSTAANPGYGVKPLDPSKLSDPIQNINFTADYLGGKGKHLGVRDWNDPQQVAVALRGYNGGGDPRYVQNVMGSAYAAALSPGGGGGSAPVAAAAAPAPAPITDPRAAAVSGISGPDYARLALEASGSRNPMIRQYAQTLSQLATTQGRDRTADLAEKRFSYEQSRDAQRDQIAAQNRAMDLAVRGQERAEDRRYQDMTRAEQQRFQQANQVAGFQQQERMLGLQEEAAIRRQNTPLAAEVEAQKTRLAQAAVPQPENKFVSGAATNAVKTLDEERAAAQQATTSLASAERIKGLVDQAYTGAGAEWKQSLHRQMVAAGLADGKTVASTEQLQAELAKNALSLATDMKGALSDKDIQFLEKAQAGGIAAQPETIKRLADLAAQAARARITNYNQRSELARGIPGMEGSLGQLAYPNVTVPPATQPAAPAAASGGWSIRPR